MSSTYVTSEGRLRLPPPESQKRYAGGGGDADSASEEGDSILLGESVAVRRLRSQIQRIAPHFRTALIRGETGSGKQLVARAIHALSPGAAGPFIVTTASALVESLAAN